MPSSGDESAEETEVPTDSDGSDSLPDLDLGGEPTDNGSQTEQSPAADAPKSFDELVTEEDAIDASPGSETQQTSESNGEESRNHQGRATQTNTDSNQAPEQTPSQQEAEATEPDDVVVRNDDDFLLGNNDSEGAESSLDIDESLPGEDDDEGGYGADDKAIEEIRASQEYIRIYPVREEITAETIKQQLYGLHRYGRGRKLPLDIELHVDAIEGVANFEFIIYKPDGKGQGIEFYIGPGERGDVSLEKLESSTRSQYPENYEFDHESFDIQDVFDEVPHLVRFEGWEERRKDWMTTMTMFETEESDRSPLSNLLETAVQMEEEVLYQVVFEPRSDWERKARRQKGLIKRGVNSNLGLMFQTLFDQILGASDNEKQERHRGETPEEVGGSIHDSQVGGARSGTDRMGQIDLKEPETTYNVAIRAATSTEHGAKRLEDSLSHLSGQFYEIRGKHVGQNENEYRRMLNHGITYPNGWESMRRRKPMLVCNVGELANFITVPSVDALPKASRGATGGKPAAQAPLTSLNENVFEEFDEGMTIGRAETELHERERDTASVSEIESKNEWMNRINDRAALSLSPDHLTKHYFRAATTGSGKTVATLNDMLTAYNELEGPVILVDPKDGDMCENYLRCHRTLFGDTEDVEYIQIPEEDGMVPGMPFFDIRPLIHAGGRTRETAVQDIIDHYFELLKFEMGDDKVDQAFVANEILKNLIKARFDEEYGKDHFSIGELMETAQKFSSYGKQLSELDENGNSDDNGPTREEVLDAAIPDVSDKQIESSLKSHLDKDPRQFENTTDAVLNRIRKLKERDFIWDMLSYTVPDEHWDDELGWYDTTNIPMLDMRSILNADSKVILIDTGELRSASSDVFSMLFLSHVYTAAKSIWTPNTDEYIANIIIEESASIARNEIVYDGLLPKGREFNISLGLVMQYTEQVLGEDFRRNQRAYKEVLNNINTKIVGNIAADDTLADSLFHENLEDDEIKDRIAGLRRGEWVVQLPSTGFDEQKPEIMTVKPLPIPPGHNAGPISVPSRAESVRARTRRKRCVSRDSELVDTESGLQDFSLDSIRDAGEDQTRTSAGEKHDVDHEAELTLRHESFLQNVVDALTDGLNNYHLGKSMSEIPNSDKASDLVEWGYLEKTKIGNNQNYYKPTKDALALIDEDLRPRGGGEKGGESLEHRVGVKLAATVYSERGYNTKMYEQEREGGDLYDMVAYAPTNMDARDQYIEVETADDHKQHMLEDQKKMAATRGEAIWIVETMDAAYELCAALRERYDAVPTGSESSLEEMNEVLDVPGVDKITTLNKLREEAKEMF